MNMEVLMFEFHFQVMKKLSKTNISQVLFFLFIMLLIKLKD